MTSRDFISAEAHNTDRIVLYREGLFWKAYERSAFALCSQVRPLKPTRKVLKALGGGDLISVGFPTAAETATLGSLSVIERTDERLTVATPRPVSEQEFRVWKASTPVKPQPSRPKAAPEDLAASGDSTLGASAASVVAGPVETSIPADTVETSAVAGSAGAVPVVWTVPREGQRSFLRRLFRWFRPAAGGSGTSCASSAVPAERRIADSLKDFNLADKTPMECMLFISELKNMLVNR